MNNGTTEREEVVLQGIGASPGVAVGMAYPIITEDEYYVERDIRDDDIPKEVVRFADALIATRQQLHEIQKTVRSAMGQDRANIFDAHLLVVDDPSFVDQVVSKLRETKKNVETALRVVVEQYVDALSRVEDDYLRERAADVKDVSRRIMRSLAGKIGSSLAEINQPCIIVSNDLAPSDAATIKKDRVLGFATDLGSMTSHTAIMARGLGIPAVVGLHNVSAHVGLGDRLLIDGNKGVVIINPSLQRLDTYGKIAEHQQIIRAELATLRNDPAETVDGFAVVLSANLEMPEDVEAVISQGGDGVGLFRTEFLYLSRPTLPTESEQVDIYSRVASRLYPKTLIVRTLDLGGDKVLPQFKNLHEVNPFMGWRAIRFCLGHLDIFMTQLRAILQASCHENIKIMYPMVSNVEEVIQANNLLAEAKSQLRKAGVKFNENIEVGVMIEVPSAAITAHLIAPHVSFFSLGTNDLVQYTMAVDRVNERVAYLYEPTHPAIIKLIKNTIDVGHRCRIWTGICGEMAGNPLLVPLLLGLGIDEFSVSPSLLPMVKRIIRSITYTQAEEVAQRALNSDSAKKILEDCRNLVKDVAPELIDLIE